MPFKVFIFVYLFIPNTKFDPVRVFLLYEKAELAGNEPRLDFTPEFFELQLIEQTSCFSNKNCYEDASKKRFSILLEMCSYIALIPHSIAIFLEISDGIDVSAFHEPFFK